MKEADVAVPASALDTRRSPLGEETRTEYAVEAGGSVLSHKRFTTQEDAYFYGCLLPNARDRERCGHVMIKRRVVQRRVVFNKWTPSSEDFPERKMAVAAWNKRAGDKDKVKGK